MIRGMWAPRHLKCVGTALAKRLMPRCNRMMHLHRAEAYLFMLQEDLIFAFDIPI
jgi:hypothetical protein